MERSGLTKAMLGEKYSRPTSRQPSMHGIRALMYSHSPERNRVDVVDLDPYGTAAPFIDAAVQCITDGGRSIEPLDSFCLDLIRIIQGFCVSHVLTSPSWLPTIIRRNG